MTVKKQKKKKKKKNERTRIATYPAPPSLLASTWKVAKTTSPSQRYSGSQEGALPPPPLPAAERRAEEEEGESAIVNLLGDERSFGEACGVACRLRWCRGDVGDVGDAMEAFRALSAAIGMQAAVHFCSSKNEKEKRVLIYLLKNAEGERGRQVFFSTSFSLFLSLSLSRAKVNGASSAFLLFASLSSYRG